MKNVVTIGGAMLDLYIQQETDTCNQLHQNGSDYLLLAIGKKLEITGIEKQSGGGATNAAVSFARLGFSTTTICSLGADCEGDFIARELADNGVNTEELARNPNATTGLSIIIPCPKGERTVLAYRGANLLLAEKNISQTVCNACDALYITSLTGATASLLLPIARHAKKQGKIIATNPGTSQLIRGTKSIIDALPYLDIFILNSFEAQQCMRSLMHHTPKKFEHDIPLNTESPLPALLQAHSRYHMADFNLRMFCTEILARGPRVVVVTNGDEGVYVAQENILYFHPALTHNVVSTVGAGDAFGSCFVASLLQEKSVPEALVNGIIQATSVIQSIGAKTGLLTATELERRAQMIGIQSIRHFPL